MLLRAEELEELGGFDVEFVNGMEDVDLCLRMSERFGGRFAVAPDARVTHLEGKTPAGRTDQVLPNRSAFMRRWRSRLPAPDTAAAQRHRVPARPHRGRRRRHPGPPTSVDP